MSETPLDMARKITEAMTPPGRWYADEQVIFAKGERGDPCVGELAYTDLGTKEDIANAAGIVFSVALARVLVEEGTVEAVARAMCAPDDDPDYFWTDFQDEARRALNRLAALAEEQNR